MSTTLDVSKLKVDLEKVRQRMRNVAVRKGVTAGARVIAEAMVERTPEQIEKQAGSNSLQPGEVKASIKIRSRTSRAGNPYALVGPTGEAGAAARVAHLVEYGHRMVVSGASRMNAVGKFVGPGRAKSEDVPPHPFLRPAFEASAAAAGEAIAQAIDMEMKKI